MKSAPLLVSVSLAWGLILAAGCDKSSSNKSEDKPASPQAEAQPAKPGPAATPGGPANPHVAAPHAAKAEPLGPPREVTPSGETREEVADGLVMKVPKEWERREVHSQMRKASLVWPGPGGDVELLVYRFPGGAGTVEQNIDRWTGQVEVGDGPPAERIEVEAGSLKISGIDVRGKFGGQAMPGVPPTPAVEDARMFAVAVEGSGDPWYLKVVGPAKTVDLWADAWTTMLGELAAGSGGSGDAAAPADAADPAEPPPPAKQ